MPDHLPTSHSFTDHSVAWATFNARLREVIAGRSFPGCCRKIL